jgi:hypothetical protein
MDKDTKRYTLWMHKYTRTTISTFNFYKSSNRFGSLANHSDRWFGSQEWAQNSYIVDQILSYSFE